MTEYKLVICPRCGSPRVTQALKTFKCFSCGYQTRMARVTVWARSQDPLRLRALAKDDKKLVDERLMYSTAAEMGS